MKYLKMLGLSAAAVMTVMSVIGVTGASATTLEVDGVAQNKSLEITLSLEPGTSILLKDSAGTTTDTCTISEIKGATAKDEEGNGDFSGRAVSGPISIFTLGGCSHTSKVLSKGSLVITRIGTSTDGTFASAGAEVTFFSTVFGVSAICKTGSETDLGALTGATNGTTNNTKFATLDLKAKISCGILGTSTWTGTYIATGPEELAVTG